MPEHSIHTMSVTPHIQKRGGVVCQTLIRFDFSHGNNIHTVFGVPFNGTPREFWQKWNENGVSNLIVRLPE